MSNPDALPQGWDFADVDAIMRNERAMRTWTRGRRTCCELLLRCDNLYTSAKFAKWCLDRQTYICGTRRTNRGIPVKVKQKEETKKAKKLEAAEEG